MVKVTSLALMVSAALAAPAFAGMSGPQLMTDEQIAAHLESIKRDPSAVLGDEFIELVRKAASTNPQVKAEVFKEIAATTLDAQEKGWELAQEMAAAEWEAAEKSGAVKKAAAFAGANANDERLDVFKIFVSQSMPMGELKALVDAYAGRADVQLVFRGFKPDQKIDSLQRLILQLIHPIEEGMPIPSVSLDPEAFTDLGVDAVPVIAKFDDKGDLVAYATGIASASWLADRIEAGSRGNLGSFGNTRQIVEENVIERLQRDAAKVAQRFESPDERAKVLSRFWGRQAKTAYPRVEVERVFEIDPSVRLTRDIKTPAGQFIARAGDVINPLDGLGFDQTMLFFDPADRDQVSWVKRRVQEEGVGTVIVMAVQLGSLGGFEGLASMSDAIGVPLFLMQPEVKQKFQIERVPALVRAEGLVFVKHEQIPVEPARKK